MGFRQIFLYFLLIPLSFSVILTFEGGGSNLNGDLQINISTTNSTSGQYYTKNFSSSVNNGRWFEKLDVNISDYSNCFYSFRINTSWYLFANSSYWWPCGALLNTTSTTSSSSNITGSGTSGRIAYWSNGSNILFSSARLVENGTSNFFLGLNAGNASLSGATNNFGMGENALKSVSSGDFNLALGDTALGGITTGGSNTGIGQEAGNGLNDDSQNTFIGKWCGRNIDTGSGNTAIGSTAMGSGTSAGSYNTAIGYAALNSIDNTGTAGNTALGAFAMRYTEKTSSPSNVVIGYQAGFNLSGTTNVLIGRDVASSNPFIGSGNVFIGYLTRSSITSLNNTLGIDNSNTNLTLINGSFASDYVSINGNLGVNTTPGYPLEVGSNISGISIYAQGNVSATGYITRTSIYDLLRGRALSWIRNATDYKKANGEINHSMFYGYTGANNITDFSRPLEITTIDEEGNINTNVTYPYTKITEGVSLEMEIDALRQAIYEIKSCAEEKATYTGFRLCLSGIG